jgi:hypothetical protein
MTNFKNKQTKIKFPSENLKTANYAACVEENTKRMRACTILPLESSAVMVGKLVGKSSAITPSTTSDPPAVQFQCKQCVMEGGTIKKSGK